MKQPLGAPLAAVLLAVSVGCASCLRRALDAGEGGAAASAALPAVALKLVGHAQANLTAESAPAEAKPTQSSVKLAVSRETAGTWQGSLFVFGYGSLLKEMSRIKTTCNLTSVSESTLDFLDRFAWVTPSVRECIESVRSRTMILVKAKGVRRGWYDAGKLQGEAEMTKLPPAWQLQALDLSPTYLGAVADPDAECYGVVYPVNEEELELTDKRELAYGTVSPMWLGSEHLDVLSKGYQLPLGARVRWYELSKERVARPSVQHPICQSYVDVFVGGALELAQAHHRPDYAENVVLTTHGWSDHWVNDRIVPFRPYVHESKAPQIVRTLVKAAGGPHSPLSLEHLSGVRFPLDKAGMSLAMWSSAARLAPVLLLLVLPLQLFGTR